MITAKDALKNALESEYVSTWLNEANREIIEASTSIVPQSCIVKNVDWGCANMIANHLESLGYEVTLNAYASSIKISWL